MLAAEVEQESPGYSILHTYILYTYMYIYMVLVLYIGFSACLHELDSRPIFFFVLGNDYTIEPLP